MADNSFTSINNKELLWEMMLSNNMFNGIGDNNFNNVKIMFENVIMRLAENIKGEISRDELLSLNKTAILEIKNNLDIFRRTNNQNNINHDINFNSEKILIFDKELQTIKNDFEDTISIKKPQEPEFSSKTDTPFSKDNMNELLEKLQRERNQLIEPEIKSNVNNDSTEYLMPESDENIEKKKVTNINELFTLQSDKEDISKRVSFVDDVPINNKKIEILQKNNSKNSLENILQHEYSGERKTNNDLKLNSIFNLLKEIDEKQNKILELLKF